MASEEINKGAMYPTASGEIKKEATYPMASGEMNKRAIYPMASGEINKGVKRKRVVLSLKEKLDIIKRLDNGEKAAILAQEYNVGKSSVMDIKMSKNSLLSFVSSLENSAVVTKRKTMKCAYNKELDNAVYSWYLNMKKNGQPIPGPVICDKALELNVTLGGSPDFKASGGWLNNFKFRHGLDFPINGNTSNLQLELPNTSVQETSSQASESTLTQMMKLENHSEMPVSNEVTPVMPVSNEVTPVMPTNNEVTPVVPRVKRKHVVLSLQQKLDIINRLNNGEMASNLAREYKIGKSTVKDIKTSQVALLDYVSEFVSPVHMQKRKTMKCAYNKDLDHNVYKWYIHMLDNGHTISGPQICDKALEMNQLSGGPSDFKASSGWLQNFKSRHGLSFKVNDSSSLSYANPEVYPDIYYEDGKMQSPHEYDNTNYDNTNYDNTNYDNTNSYQDCEPLPICDVILKESDESYQLDKAISDSCDLPQPVNPELLHAIDTVLDWTRHHDECTSSDIVTLTKLRDLACNKGMSVAFSSDDSETISRTIEDSTYEKRDESLSIEEMYEVERCVEWINTNGFSRIALQFPDSLLGDATGVALKLGNITDKQLFVLGDTSFGSCCVDEIAAEHVSADAIIHFGHACLSPTRRLPVLFIFGKQVIDVQDAADAFFKLFPDKLTRIIIFYEVIYAFSIGTLLEKLQEYRNLVICQLEIPGEEYNTTSSETQKYLSAISKCHRRMLIPQHLSLNDYSVFYIGSRNVTLTNLMMSLKNCPFYTYNPSKKLARAETLDVNKHLKRRYYYIEKAKDAKIIGILVGTLGVVNYLAIIQHLKELIKHVGKKSYTLVVGKLNNAKLANFAEIEVFVNVACVESSLIESRDFYQPIITPHELEIALNQAREWTGDYITDFSEILPGAANYVPLSLERSFESDVSLVTGKIRHATLPTENEAENDPDSVLAVRDEMKISVIHAKGAGEYLVQRSWQGLEQKLGETPVYEVEEGLRGIASQYENERTDENI